MSKGGGGGGNYSRSDGGKNLRGGQHFLSSKYLTPEQLNNNWKSVLSRLSDAELARYKQAFQNADKDEDGYLNLVQTLEALQSCGLTVTGGSMLDSLDEVEQNQESEIAASAFESEQNRRRRRRRRNSLAHIEQNIWSEEQRNATEKMRLEAEAAAAAASTSNTDSGNSNNNGKKPAAAASGAPLTRSTSTSSLAAYESAPSTSSFKAPSIDISTFLSLVHRPSERDIENYRKSSSRSVSSTPKSRSSITEEHPNAPPQQQQQGQEEWRLTGYQAASNASPAATAALANRPFEKVSINAPPSPSPHHTEPNLRMRLTHQQSTFHPLKNKLRGRVDDFDDDYDFDPESDLLAAFQTFDSLSTGTISSRSMLAILTNLGEKMSEEEAMEMIAEWDTMGEGRIRYPALVKHLMTRD